VAVGFTLTMILSRGVIEQRSVEDTAGQVLSGQWVGMMAEKCKKRNGNERKWETGEETKNWRMGIDREEDKRLSYRTTLNVPSAYMYLDTQHQ